MIAANKIETLQQLCDQFESYKKHIAVFSFGAENTKHTTFQELVDSIHRLAAGLAQSGLQHQETVMLLADNSEELIIACLAVIYAGGVCVPVDQQSDAEVLKHIVQDSEAKWIFVDTKGFEKWQHLKIGKAVKTIRLDDDKDSNSWRKLVSKDKIDFDQVKPEDEAVLFYTSGTTGMPKGVPLTHANIIFQLEAVAKTKLVQKSDVILLPLPLFHVYPFVIGLLVPLSTGATVVLPKSITGPEIIRATKEGKATILIAVPRLLRALYTAIEAKARSNNIDSTAFGVASSVSKLTNLLGINIGKLLFKKLHKRFPTLRLLSCGGALLEPDLATQLMSLGWEIAIGYGLTETSPLLTVRMPNNRDLKSIGKPIPGIDIRIAKVKTEDAEQPEIQAKGESIFSGYRNLPKKTKESFTEDGWFKTGDTGYMSLGNLYITGRISTMLKSQSGKKIPPEEIEKAYEKNPAIREIGILQDKDKLVALIVPNITAIGHDDPNEKIGEAIKKASATQPSYYRLTDFALTKELLPRTNLGKIRRQELIERYKKAKAAPKNKSGHKEEMSAEDKVLLEDPIAKEFWQWLNDRFPDADINFNESPQVDLNIDSLAWLNLTLEIQDRFGIELNEEAIARIDTVRDLVKEIIEASHSGKQAISPFEHPEQILDEDQKKWLKPLNPFMLILAQTLYWAIFVVARIYFRVSAVGAQNIPNEQVIFTPNHESYLDPFVLTAVLDVKRLRKTQFAGWAGIALNNPFNAFIYRLAQSIPIDAKRSLVSSLALAMDVLKKHRSLVWFPEGERTLTGKLLPFRSGIGMLLQNSDVKAVPVCIVGTREALGPGSFIVKPHKITIYFGEAVTAKELLKIGPGNNDAERIANGLHNKVMELKLKAKQSGNK